MVLHCTDAEEHHRYGIDCLRLRSVLLWWLFRQNHQTSFFSLLHPVMHQGHQDSIDAVMTHGFPEGSLLVDLAPVTVMVHAALTAAVAGPYDLTRAHQYIMVLCSEYA